MGTPASRLATLFFGNRRRVALTLTVGSLLAAAAILAGVYRHLTDRGMIARQNPSALETFIGRRLVDASIPQQFIAMQNPLDSSAHAANEAAGHALFQKNCQTCHGFDGSGKTLSGGGLYPRPVDLRSPHSTRRSDGALFYLIRNGIRNTGMPGWQLTDEQTWQLVAYLRNLPVVATPSTEALNAPTATQAYYVGSAACATCHATVYERWKKTLMANVVRDPKDHPDAILPDLSVPNALVNFTKNDIAFVYGSKWKQRYFKKIGDDYFPLPAQWDVTHKQWKPYFVKDDWWAPLYPPDNFKRPTSATCDGCHSVNYDVSTKSVTEWNVGCEKCHGPGSEHASHPLASNIINPARLDYVQATDTCIQCHSQGRPTANPIAGKFYDWPVGFHMGKKLSDFWTLEAHKLGETTFTHFADGTAHKNRMQGNDFVTSVMYEHDISCFTCHDSHGTDNNALLRKPGNAMCLDCHGSTSPNGPRESTLEAHTHHKPGSAGSQCIECHMPKIAQTLGDINVRSHTFRFVGPAMTDALKVPNACNVCHKDQSTNWTASVLKTWAERSPWRMARWAAPSTNTTALDGSAPV